MRVFEALCSQALDCLRRGPMPTIRQVYLPEPAPHSDRATEFGLIELSDGCAGLYYAWLGEGQSGMAERYSRQLPGLPLDALLAPHRADDVAARSLAVAALNALAAHVWSLTGFEVPAAQGGFGFELRAPGPLGMVGNFVPLVRHAQAAGIPVVVVERKSQMWREEPGLKVTGDLHALAACRQVICTAATLLNDSLDEVLSALPPGAELALLGPTASMLPDILFQHGFSVVAGTAVRDVTAAMVRLRGGESMGNAALKYAIAAARYPGTAQLLGV